ncbi:MAG: hypothetical protein HC898_04055 [Phycisphaerales bacterium]|nr:hypothetical protein [Phycisphaerales bacterium]
MRKPTGRTTSLALQWGMPGESKTINYRVAEHSRAPKLGTADDPLPIHPRSVGQPCLVCPAGGRTQSFASPQRSVDDLTTLFLETAKKQLPEYPQRARTLMVSLLDVLQGPPADPHQPLWAELEKYTGSIIATPAQGNTAPTATTQTVP